MLWAEPHAHWTKLVYSIIPTFLYAMGRGHLPYSITLGFYFTCRFPTCTAACGEFESLTIIIAKILTLTSGSVSAQTDEIQCSTHVDYSQPTYFKVYGPYPVPDWIIITNWFSLFAREGVHFRRLSVLWAGPAQLMPFTALCCWILLINSCHTCTVLQSGTPTTEHRH